MIVRKSTCDKKKKKNRKGQEINQKKKISIIHMESDGRAREKVTPRRYGRPNFSVGGEEHSKRRKEQNEC